MENEAGTVVVPKVAICCPAGDTVATLFCHDLARMFGHTIRTAPEIELRYLVMPGSLIPKQREMLALEVLTTDCTHILWLDTDMRFPPNTLLRLLDRKVPIVASNYVERRPPFRPVAFPKLERASTRLFTEPEDTGLVKVDAVGFGVVLMETAVFRKMPEPWFAVGWVPDTKEYVGEDVFFCSKARQYGETIWLDHDLSREVEHIGHLSFNMTHGQQFREYMDEPEPTGEGAVA